MQKRKINVVPYDPNWIRIFESHAGELQKALGENIIEVYHVGSTSVPELCAKPEIDIMCVVKDLKTTSKPLESIGYIAKGEFNLPMRLFFSRKTPDDINLHVVNKNSGEIEWNLCFQNYLRENKESREMYAKVKLALVNQNPDGFDILHNSISEYTTSKGEVIRKIAKLADFNGYRFVIAFNDYEINACKTLLNLEKINLESPHIFNLCLYKGTEITAAALLEFNEDFSKAKIEKINAIDNENKTILLSKIDEWLKFKGATLEEQLFLTKPSEEYADEICAFRDEFVAARPKGAENDKYAGLDLNGAGMLWQFENPLDWIENSRLCENKETLPDKNLVTATQYIFVRENDKKIVGVIHFRHYFNDFLEKYGGHIGYSICPSERRKGYGTLMLSECLKEIKKYSNLEKVLLTCNDTNKASKKTIIANGGIYENTVYCEPNDCNLERYWIDCKKKIIRSAKMKIVKNAETIKETRPTCVITDYRFGNKNIDLVIAEIKGRYPETGYCINEKCDEIAYILEGKVVLTKKGGEPMKLNIGDAVLVGKGEAYLWDGNCKMTISCTPAWSFEQYKHITDEVQEAL